MIIFAIQISLNIKKKPKFRLVDDNSKEYPKSRQEIGEIIHAIGEITKK